MIQIVPIPTTFVVTHVRISLSPFSLFATETTASVDYMINEDRAIDRKVVHIPPDIYAYWGTDDTFIVDYVLEQLGITRSGV